MNYTKALHKKVINANSSEKIAPTDGINPFPANASGCADGNYRMHVNMGAPGSTATRTAEPGRSGDACPGPSWPLGKGKTGFGKGLGCAPSALQLQLLKPTPKLTLCLSSGMLPWPGGNIGRGSGHSRGVSGLIPAHSGQENSQAPAQPSLGVLVGCRWFCPSQSPAATVPQPSASTEGIWAPPAPSAPPCHTSLPSSPCASLPLTRLRDGKGFFLLFFHCDVKDYFQGYCIFILCCC